MDLDLDEKEIRHFTSRITGIANLGQHYQEMRRVDSTDEKK